MVDTVVFDVYGVIMRESKGNFLPYVLTRHPALTRDWVSAVFRRGGVGELSGQQMLELLGFRGNLAAVERDYLDNHLTLDPGVLPVLQALSEQWALAVLSNDVAQWSRHIFERHGLDRFFGVKVISGDVGLRKPDRAIFELLLTRLQRPAAACVFIDNSAANLRVARALGMQTIHFNRDGEEYDGLQVEGFADLQAVLDTLK